MGIKQIISDWGASFTFADYAQKIALYFVPSLGVAGVMGWAASATAWLQAWGPIAYVSAGILAGTIAALTTATVCALTGVGRNRRTLAAFQQVLVNRPHSVNPLEMSFTRVAIDIADLNMHSLPFRFAQRNKIFTECILSGPGTILFIQCRGTLADFPGTNFTWYNEHGFVYPDVVFDRCTFVDCRLVNLTVFVSKADEINFRQSFPYLRWTDEPTPTGAANSPIEDAVVIPRSPASDSPSL